MPKTENEKYSNSEKNLFISPLPTERILVLSKRDGLMWEAEGVTNPGVIRLPDGTIAMLYRGNGGNKNSYLGYCRLDADGKKIVAGSRSEIPLYSSQSRSELVEFPDGYGDPRINKVGDWYYIWTSGRNNKVLKENRLKYDNDFSNQYMGGRQIVAFRTRDFGALEYLGQYGPREYDKNSFLHPEAVTINDTYHIAMFHRVQYSIQVAIAPKIELFAESSFWDQHIHNLSSFIFAYPIFGWEGVSNNGNWPGSIAGGAPPIEINPYLINARELYKKFWLLFYNGSGSPRPGTVAQGRQIGALIYTTKSYPDTNSQPFEIIHRVPTPILSPKEIYEKQRSHGDIVFATGAVKTLDEKSVDLFYGSGDQMISKARFALEDLVSYISRFDKDGNIRI